MCVINVVTGLHSNVSEFKGFSHLQGSHFHLIVCNNLPVVSLIQPPPPTLHLAPSIYWKHSILQYVQNLSPWLLVPHDSPFLRILTLTTGPNDQTVTSLPSSLAVSSP